MSDKLTIKQLEEIANELRKDVVNMLTEAGSGHTAGSLGLVDLITALYFNIMKLNPIDPNWKERDVLFLSNGHVVPAQYAAMAHRGYFPKEELKTLRKLGSRLQGHPERTRLPGIENTSGPLGSGLSQAAGYAYSLQYLDKSKHRWVYAITGDGELDEGNIWEAAMFAAKYKLSQLIVFIDRNNIQIDGTTEDVMPLGDLRAKWEGFDWHVQEIDGHNFESIISAASMARAVTTKPSVIITNTIPGKGVDFMEYDYKWHGVSPSKEQCDEAIKKLKVANGQNDTGDIR